MLSLLYVTDEFKFHFLSKEFKSLWPLLDLVVDGGKIGQENEEKTEASRSGSTIVDLSVSGHYRIVRSGW